MTTAAFEIDDLTRAYGALRAVDSVSLTVDAGARHALIGPNGAGKSTMFKLLSGEVRPSSGRIRYFGTDITGYAQPRRVRMRIAQTYQHSSVFMPLTVRENVALAAQRVQGIGTVWWRAARRYTERTTWAEENLAAVGLEQRADDLAASLSHGERRQLELALALASRPRVLLLDEPTAGMSASESADFVTLVKGLPPELTVIVVEHDLDVVFSLATQISVLHHGQLLATGGPDEVSANPAVQEAYLSWSAAEDDPDADPVDEASKGERS
ncbi:ABC transporter ATP-binding protein [Solwaraspora sp. WMMD1047]|uniref:ABC transporter ATP-binding protein n=1 Tax=Solwaraspora sp. WMMD1047 TaxID=3016102 RepID=UPI002418069C|nr:ABC transporter ATP-binding protein [Solwaraspora sp. WMMD1047]MDG4830568.1 ABC transporter ATP-binding protein [Solwaraspora sp. WMMD1047]